MPPEKAMPSRIPFRLKVVKVYPSHTRLPDGTSRYASYADVEIIATGDDGRSWTQAGILLELDLIRAMAYEPDPSGDEAAIEEGQEFGVALTPRDPASVPHRGASE